MDRRSNSIPAILSSDPFSRDRDHRKRKGNGRNADTKVASKIARKMERIRWKRGKLIRATWITRPMYPICRKWRRNPNRKCGSDRWGFLRGTRMPCSGRYGVKRRSISGQWRRNWPTPALSVTCRNQRRYTRVTQRLERVCVRVCMYTDWLHL